MDILAGFENILGFQDDVQVVPATDVLYAGTTSGTVTTNTPDQTDRGVSGYSYFHNKALAYPNNYMLSLEAVKQLILSKSPNFFSLFGKAIVQSNISENDLKTRMESLADQNQGLLPNQLSIFLKVVDPVIDSNLSWSWINNGFPAIVQGVEDSVAAGAAVVSSVGSAGISGITSTLKWLPIILAVGVGIYAFSKGKSGVLP